jgi:succinoglycan biosynthesis protein ExoM
MAGCSVEHDRRDGERRVIQTPGVIMNKGSVEHISVCIPTFKRPRMLQRCLEALSNQTTTGFRYSVVVVDNDANRSARDVVEEWKGSMDIIFDVEPIQNISLARNRAISASRGELLAFIDDDEFPERSWLTAMLGAYHSFSANGVLGPVEPFYPEKPPEWLVRSGLCVRESFTSGTPMESTRYMRTGNVLLEKRMFNGIESPFDPRLGLSGGEDADMFDHMLRRGESFVWCQEARVYEEVPRERQTRTYLIRRAFIRGVTSADQEGALSSGTLKSLVALLVYSLSLPVLFFAGYHHFMKYLVKDCDHLAKLLAHCGIRLVEERTF